MLVHGGQRGEAEAVADLLQAGRIAVLLDELVEVIQNLALALGERLQRGLLAGRRDREIPATGAE